MLNSPTDGPWQNALNAARAGDVPSARTICESLKQISDPFPAAHDFLLGRCLAESGENSDEAIALLQRAGEINPRNILIPHTLALALLRGGRSAEAAVLLRDHGLPHDLVLLAQLALSMESALRPWPSVLPDGWPAPVAESEPQPVDPTVPVLPSSPPREKPQLRWSRRRRLSKLLDLIERLFTQHRLDEGIQQINRASEEGLEDDDLHLLGGMISEEAGDAARARTHLAVALQWEPRQLMARSFLGRVYWRNGWNDLAEDLWRSLPIEGPDDFGRHYHLALALDAQGRRTDALASMDIALRDFFMETREFHIERLVWRWMQNFSTANSGNRR